MSSFTFLHERAVPVSGGDLMAAECCPAMDLIALASPVHLVIQRSFKWEQLHTLPCALTSMVWRPDGKTLAVGHDDGSLTIYDVERGEEFVSERNDIDAMPREVF
jgi:WD40 repeat protein